ncbi:hypothetical protein T440DRAFT_400737, partial [Plenodomus tracheiphilus IPT5]
DAADVESPLKPDELQVLRAQYEKEGEYVGLQTKFNYAWGLIKSTSRPDQQEGVRLLSEIFRNSRERRRECLYYLALGNYKLGNYAEARRYNELLLELEPANLQAGSLKGLIDDKVAKEGMVGETIDQRLRQMPVPNCDCRFSPNTSPPRYLPTYCKSTVMDSPTDQAAAAQPQRPAHRDMMFCHECADEWYRDERGLTCPECGSDFTEIIEENNDPRDSVMFGDDDNDSMSDLAQGPPHLHPAHNPWASDDPEEADISNYHFTQTAPGRFNIHATITRSVSPQGLQGGPASIGGFMSLLNGLVGTAVRPPGQSQGQSQGQAQAQGQGVQDGQSRGAEDDQDRGDQSTFNEARSQGADGPQFRTGRFTYHGGARLFPRDANNPQPRVEPVDDIANVMTGLMAALGAPPGSVHPQPHPLGGAQATFGGVHNAEAAQMQAHPFFQLFSSMGLLPPGSGQMGDFVYSQEGLDRIVSQLMEQTATSNAPGPAAQSDIEALPRKKVTEDMLGPEHTAECSICMDDVSVGEEVTELPCKHWFHHQCVAAWLVEHDTCPHCRKGITKREGSEGEQSQGAQQGGERSRSMPGAFETSDTQQAGAGSESVGERARGGWFGPGS